MLFVANETSFSGAASGVRVNGNYSLTTLYLLLSSVLLCSASSSFNYMNSDFQTLFCSISLSPSGLNSFLQVLSSLFILEVKERSTPSVAMTVNDTLSCRYSSRW